MKTANVKMVMSVLQFALPVAVGLYAIGKVKAGMTNLFKLPTKTKREMFENSDIKNNVAGITLMSHNLNSDYQLDINSYESQRSLHPDNAEILDVVLDPLRRVKDQFIVYIDNTIIDKALLHQLGEIS